LVTKTSKAAGITARVAASNHRKVRGLCFAPSHRRFRCCQSRSISVVLGQTPKISRVSYRWINHQVAAVIIFAQLETDLIVGLQNEACIDQLAAAVLPLVGYRLVQTTSPEGKKPRDYRMRRLKTCSAPRMRDQWERDWDSGATMKSKLQLTLLAVISGKIPG